MPYIIEVVKAGNTIEVSKYYSSRFNKKGVKRGKRKQLTTGNEAGCMRYMLTVCSRRL